MDPREQLLTDIEAYIARRGIKASTFGLYAVDDGKFVNRLRAGKNMTLATIARAQLFLASHPADSRSRQKEVA